MNETHTQTHELWYAPGSTGIDIALINNEKDLDTEDLRQEDPGVGCMVLPSSKIWQL